MLNILKNQFTQTAKHIWYLVVAGHTSSCPGLEPRRFLPRCHYSGESDFFFFVLTTIKVKVNTDRLSKPVFPSPDYSEYSTD